MADPKPHTHRDPAYLAFLRRCTCSWCGRPPPSEAAHQGGGRGIATKGPDDRAVPLCRRCHRYQHDHGVLYLSGPYDSEPLRWGATLSGAGLRAWAEAEAARLRARYATLSEDAW